MTTALVKLDEARLALREAKEIWEVKDIIDIAKAAEVYSKESGLAEDSIRYATEIKIDAERRLGQLLKATPKNKGGNSTGNHRVPVKTLKELGISKNLSSRAQKLATLDDEKYEDAKATVIDDSKGGTKKVIKEVKKEERKLDIKRQRKEIEKGIKAPTGNFDVIVIDPPWAYDSDKNYDPDTRRISNPYPTMTQEELKEIKIPSKTDSVMFLWTTHKHIFNAKELLDKWGFDYKCVMVWDKEKIGMGVKFRYQCEFCLVGTKGKPFWDNTKYSELVRESRREHSRKPEAFYELIEKITAGEKLDYFSRCDRDGWKSFGNDRRF